KAAAILRKRGGGETLLVLPPVEANPGPQAFARIQRAAEMTSACAVQPVGRASWADAARCFLEPLTVFGLVGVERREIHALVRPRVALLHLWEEGRALEQALRLPSLRDVLVTCRLRPTATLREVDGAAARVRELTKAHLVLAGPEVGNDD